MVRNAVIILLILYGGFCFAIDFTSCDGPLAHRFVRCLDEEGKANRAEITAFNKIIQAYQKCSKALRKTLHSRAKLTDKQLMMESECQLTMAQTIAKQDYSSGIAIVNARQQLESSMSYLRRVERDVRDSSLQDRILSIKTSIGSHLDLFNNNHRSKSASKEWQGGVLNSQGIRIYYVEAVTNNANLSTPSLKKKLSKITNLEFKCSKRQTPKHCEFHVTNKDGNLVEKYMGSMGNSMVYYRLSPPLSESLMAFSTKFNQLPNLASGDYEAMALAKNYKGSIDEMYFWFARYYAEFCSPYIDSTRTITGKWQTVNKYTSIVKDEIEYNYQVETAFYEMAKQSHDRFVNYQVIGLYSFKFNNDAMRSFFDIYACDSKEVKNVRKGLYVIGNNMNLLSDSVFYNNKLELVSFD